MVSCLLACQMPIDCICSTGACTAVAKGGTAAFTSGP
jgi:hypothetical protein